MPSLLRRYLPATFHERDLATLVAGHSRVWLVLSRTFHGDRHGVLRRLLGARMVEEREVRLGGIVAYRYRGRDAEVAVRPSEVSTR